MSLQAFIVVAALTCNFLAVDATFHFVSPFQWLGGNPADRSATGNFTLNGTATTEATTSVVDLLATAPPSNYTPYYASNYSSDHSTVNYTPYYAPNNSSNYSTVNLDDLPLAISHLQDPVLKLVTEADGTAGFVVFDGRQSFAVNVSDSSTTEASTTTATSESQPTSTTVVSTTVVTQTTASAPHSTQVTAAAPAVPFPGLLSFLRPYIFGPRAPPESTTGTLPTGSTLPSTTPVSERSESVPSVASTTITVEPRSIPVTIFTQTTTPAVSGESTTARTFTEARTTLSTAASSSLLPETAATTAASTGADPVTRSATVSVVTIEATTPAVSTATAFSTTPEATTEGLSTGPTTVLYEGKESSTLVPTLSSVVSTTSTTDAITTAFTGGTTDFGTATTTTGPIFDTRSGGVTVTTTGVTQPTSTQQATSPVTAAPHDRVVKITEPSTDAANFTQPPLLQGLLSSLDGVQEDGTMSPAAQDAPQYRHFYDPSQIMQSI